MVGLSAPSWVQGCLEARKVSCPAQGGCLWFCLSASHPVPAPLSLTPVVCASWISNGLIKDAFCLGPVLQQSGEGQTLGEACCSS